MPATIAPSVASKALWDESWSETDVGVGGGKVDEASIGELRGVDGTDGKGGVGEGAALGGGGDGGGGGGG